MEVTLVVKVEELKHRHIHEEEWRRIAKKVDKYAMVLKETWYRKLHPQLFIPKHVSTEEVIRKVIHRYTISNVVIVSMKLPDETYTVHCFLPVRILTSFATLFYNNVLTETCFKILFQFFLL